MMSLSCHLRGKMVMKQKKHPSIQCIPKTNFFQGNCFSKIDTLLTAAVLLTKKTCFRVMTKGIGA